MGFERWAAAKLNRMQNGWRDKASLILIIIAIIFAFAFLLYLPGWFAPFYEATGTPTKVEWSDQGAHPNQEYTLANGSVLQVFDAAWKGEAAVVRLKSRSGEVLWTVVPEYFNHYTIKSIRFKLCFVVPYLGFRLKGNLVESSGYSPDTLWKIGWNGSLEWFRYTS